MGLPSHLKSAGSSEQTMLGFYPSMVWHWDSSVSSLSPRFFSVDIGRSMESRNFLALQTCSCILPSFSSLLLWNSLYYLSFLLEKNAKLTTMFLVLPGIFLSVLLRLVFLSISVLIFSFFSLLSFFFSFHVVVLFEKSLSLLTRTVSFPILTFFKPVLLISVLYVCIFQCFSSWIVSWSLWRRCRRKVQLRKHQVNPTMVIMRTQCFRKVLTLWKLLRKQPRLPLLRWKVLN